jgi:hypothetical protein
LDAGAIIVVAVIETLLGGFTADEKAAGEHERRLTKGS